MTPSVFYASPTKLALWRQCRRRYRFRYVDRIPARPRPWLSFGQSVHAALRELFDLRPENRTWERLERAFRRSWVPIGFESPEEERSYFERGLAALRRVFEGEDLAVPRPRLLEFNLQALEGDVVICGKVDRVDDTPAGLELRDYKTGRPRAPEQALVDTAFTVYAVLLLARFKKAPTKLIWDFIETGDKIVTEREPGALARAKADLLDLVATVRADAEFPPSPSRFCVSCDYLERCDEGRLSVVEVRGGADGGLAEKALMDP